MSLLTSAGPKRPPLIGKLIDINSDKDEITKIKYGHFLELAKLAAEESSLSKVSIVSSFKIAGSAVFDDKDQNDTLIQIFLFYCRIHQRYTKEFVQIDLNHATWSFKDVVLFLREFEMIPKLLSVEDVKFVWEMKDEEKFIRSGSTSHMLSLDFDNFKDFLVRMALCAYHKPGVKKLILSINGFMTKSRHIVEAFCSLLHLHDNDWVQNFIRTEGKRTQGYYNYRSDGEKNVLLSLALSQDHEARLLAQVDYTKRPASAIATESVIGGIVAARNGGSNVFGEKLRIPSITSPARTDSVVSVGHNRKTSLFKRGTYEIPEDLIHKIENFDFNKDDSSKSSREREAANALETAFMEKLKEMGLEDEHSTTSRLSADLPHHQGSDASSTIMDFVERESPVLNHSTSVLSVFRDNSLGGLKKSIQMDYRPDLVNLLSKYCYRAAKAMETEVSYSGGPFIDLGLLSVGNQVSILLKITNNTSDVIRLDATTRDFESDDTKVVTYPNPLVHGFTRKMSVNFTVQEARKRTVIAFIEVNIV